MIEGYYYLHANGDLIYKRSLDGIEADFRESDLVRAFWPLDPTNREMAWSTLVEAGALGATAARIQDLAAKWQVDDGDAPMYAERVGCLLSRDGNEWCATRKDFINIQESPVGFGRTALDALSNLAKALGYRAQKMWGETFKDLLSVNSARLALPPPASNTEAT